MSLLFNKSFYTILLGNRILSDANGQKANVLCDMGIMGNNNYKTNICTSTSFVWRKGIVSPTGTLLADSAF